MSYTDGDDWAEHQPGARGRGRRYAPTSQRELMIRRAALVGGGLVILLILVLGVRSCRDSARQSALREYVGDVSELVADANRISDDLFSTLSEPGRRTALDFESDVRAARSGMAGILDRARSLDAPDEMAEAQEAVTLSLSLERDGLQRITELVGTALGDEGRREATERIAAQMQSFLAADVVFSQRAMLAMRRALAAEEVTDVDVPRTELLPDIAWLRPQRVSDALDSVRSGSSEAATPGVHGVGLGEVTGPGGVTLAEGQPVTLQAGDQPTITAAVQNQGESDESDLTVRVTVEGGGEPISVEKGLPSIAQGATEQVEIPISPKPPTGEELTLQVEVEPVPGERVEENNSQSYTVTFE